MTCKCGHYFGDHRWTGACLAIVKGFPATVCPCNDYQEGSR